MLELLACLLGCAAIGAPSGSDAAAINALVSEGAYVQVAKADLSDIFDAATVQGNELRLRVPLKPLSSVTLIVTKPPEDVVTISGFVSASGRDIMLQQQSRTVSLRAWLEQVKQITLHLENQ